MRAGRIGVLVMRHTDRIDRTEDLRAILADVAAAGGRIESVTESWLEDASSLGGKVMTTITEVMNAEYVRKLSVNTLRRSGRVSALWARGATGARPTGYEIAHRWQLEDPRRHRVRG